MQALKNYSDSIDKSLEDGVVDEYFSIYCKNLVYEIVSDFIGKSEVQKQQYADYKVLAKNMPNNIYHAFEAIMNTLVDQKSCGIDCKM